MTEYRSFSLGIQAEAVKYHNIESYQVHKLKDANNKVTWATLCNEEHNYIGKLQVFNQTLEKSTPSNLNTHDFAKGVVYARKHRATVSVVEEASLQLRETQGKECKPSDPEVMDPAMALQMLALCPSVHRRHIHPRTLPHPGHALPLPGWGAFFCLLCSSVWLLKAAVEQNCA